MGKNKAPKGLPQQDGMEWLSKRMFQIGSHKFSISASIVEMFVSSKNIDGNTFDLAKTPNLLVRYFNRIAKRKPRHLLELGVFRGGSAALLQLIAKPERMLALELSPERIGILDRFIETEGLEDRLRVEFGVDQSDSVLVRKLAIEHLGEGRSIDMIIDDASHLLGPTRSSFETLFPLLRPGGIYIIEDYSYLQIHISEYLDQALQGSKSARTILESLNLESFLQSGDKPCHQLAVEAMLASIVAPGLIKKVVVDRHWLEIERGPEDFENPDSFDLRALAGDEFSLLKSTPSEKLLSFLQ
jgi:predicted O-methyltransferase YrrM